MVRSRVAKATRLFLLRETKVSEIRAGVGTGTGVLTTRNEAGANEERVSSKRDLSSSYWTPHPRSGIYVPKGHEHVLDNVPASSASFEHTHWLRNVDGVEKPDHHFSTESYCYSQPINSPLNS